MRLNWRSRGVNVSSGRSNWVFGWQFWGNNDFVEEHATGDNLVGVPEYDGEDETGYADSHDCSGSSQEGAIIEHPEAVFLWDCSNCTVELIVEVTENMTDHTTEWDKQR